MLVTILGLPGTGKSSLCQASGFEYRPEPTEDIQKLNTFFPPPLVNTFIQNRLASRDNQPRPSNIVLLDSDWWTSTYVFGGISTDFPPIPIPDALVTLTIMPSEQERRIKARGRDNWQYELQYTDFYWHDRLIQAHRLHPAPTKYMLKAEQDLETLAQNLRTLLS